MNTQRILGYCFLLLLPFANLAAQQLNSGGNAWTGKTHSQQQQGRNNLYYLQQADVELRGNKDIEATFFALENAVSENPNSTAALIRRAQFKMMIGMETEARADLALARRIDPNAVDLYGGNTVGNIRGLMSYEPLRSTQQLSLAKRLDYYYDWLDAMLLAEDEAAEALNMLYEAVDLMKEDDLAKAEKTISKLLKKFGNAAIAYDLMGLLHLEQGRFNKAEKEFNRAVQLQPNYAMAWYNYGRLNMLTGNYEVASHYLNRAILQQHDLTKAHFDRARLLKKMGDLIGAIQHYNVIIELRGEGYVEALLNRGLSYKELGETTLAMIDLNKVIELDPQNANLFKNRANLHLLNGQHQRAILDYTKAIELDPEMPEAYYNRGLTHLILLDQVSACSDLMKSSDLGFKKATERWKFSCGNNN